MGRKCIVALGLVGILFSSHFTVVLIGLDSIVHRSGIYGDLKYEISKIVQKIIFPFCYSFQNGSLPFNKFDFVVGWVFREFSGPYLFLHALWNPAIRWRARVYKLAWGGVAYEISPKIKS